MPMLMLATRVNWGKYIVNRTICCTHPSNCTGIAYYIIVFVLLYVFAGGPHQEKGVEGISYFLVCEEPVQKTDILYCNMLLTNSVRYIYSVPCIACSMLVVLSYNLLSMVP